MTSDSRLILLSVLLALCSGCSYIHSEKIFHGGAKEWQMYGGNAARVNVAADELAPPLIKMWKYNAGAGFGGYPAAIVESTLFIGTLAGELHLVDIATGKGIGSTDFGSAIVGTPVVDNDIVYVTLAHDDMSILAFNVRQSKIEWQRKLGDIESSPLLYDDKLFVTTLQGNLYCLNKGTGEEVWKFTPPRSAAGTMIHSSPATDGNLVFFGSDEGTLFAVDVHTGKLAWQAATGGAIMSSPSVSSGKVFVGSLSKAFFAFDGASGKVLWKTDLGAPIFASQAVDEHHVFIGTTGLKFYCLNKEDGSIAWDYETRYIFNSTPLVTGGIVYVGCNDKNLYAFRTGTGELLWQYKMEGRVKAMPVAWREYLVVMSEDDVVLGFKAEKQ